MIPSDYLGDLCNSSNYLGDFGNFGAIPNNCLGDLGDPSNYLGNLGNLGPTASDMGAATYICPKINIPTSFFGLSKIHVDLMGVGIKSPC